MGSSPVGDAFRFLFRTSTSPCVCHRRRGVGAGWGALTENLFGRCMAVIGVACRVSVHSPNLPKSIFTRCPSRACCVQWGVNIRLNTS